MIKTNLIHEKLAYLFPVNLAGTETRKPHFFSRTPCACCGDTKAGTRTECEAMVILDTYSDGSHSYIIHDIYDVCDSCYVNHQ
jgi:hypothetical protein